MKVIRGIPSSPNWTPCALTIGNFDGVHRGHQALLKQLVQMAQQQGLKSCVMTFEPHPIEYFSPEQAPSRISNLRDKLAAIAQTGIDYVVVEHFNKSFSALSHEEFTHKVLHQGLKTRAVLIGDDFRYGAKRLGNFDTLTQAGHQYGFSVQQMPTIGLGDLRISSSATREALAIGDMRLATTLLGRPYMISGHIAHGQKLGRQWGFPTLNIAVANRLHKRKPSTEGIFVARVHGLGDNPLSAVASLGMRPTVDDSGRYLLEVHVFDFNKTVYGKLVQIELVKKIRDEKKYPDINQLRSAIHADCQAAKNYFETLNHV